MLPILTRIGLGSESVSVARLSRRPIAVCLKKETGTGVPGWDSGEDMIDNRRCVRNDVGELSEENRVYYSCIA